MLSQSKNSKQYIPFSRRRQLNYVMLFVGSASCRDGCQTSVYQPPSSHFCFPHSKRQRLHADAPPPGGLTCVSLCVRVHACACLTGITCHGASAPDGGGVKQLRRDWRSSPRHRSNVSAAVASSAMCCYIGWGVGRSEWEGYW